MLPNCKLLFCALTAGALAIACRASGGEFYLAPDGVDLFNSGTIDNPWGSLDYAIDQLSPGDTLYVRGGTYQLDERIRIRSGEGGAQGSPINIWAYADESPVLDFAPMSSGLFGSSSGRGVQIDSGANWIHMKGLTIQNAKDNGLYNEANNNVFQQLTLRWNADSGLQLDGAAANNRVLNTDSYENYDPHNNGENADGFAAKFDELGPGNVFEGSRAWGNSDDGWDLWQAASGVQILNSWAWGNGVNIWDDPAFDGDGNGFKLGQDSGDHLLANVLAWHNQVRGIDVNGNGRGVQVYNSTVYDSGRNWQFDETADDTDQQHDLRNNISLASGSSDQFLSGVDDSSNSWNGLGASADDFLSLDPTIAQGPRQPDGGLPVSDFLRLAPESELVDAGVNVGLPFFGEAPDLGAFESGGDFGPGDFDFDGDVDGLDLAIWEVSFGESTPGVAGDANSDGVVDGRDFLIWQRNVTGPGESTSAQTPVPEPSGVLLSLLAVVAARCVRPNRHRFASLRDRNITARQRITVYQSQITPFQPPTTCHLPPIQPKRFGRRHTDSSRLKAFVSCEVRVVRCPLRLTDNRSPVTDHLLQPLAASRLPPCRANVQSLRTVRELRMVSEKV